MKTPLGLIHLVTAILSLTAHPAGATPPVYRHPVATIPYAHTQPVIDGVVNDAEWQGAFSQRALQTTGGMLSVRQSRFWVMWDEEHIYVAMREPLRPGERLLQARRGRQPHKDVEVINDDCYEIWISADATDPLTGQPHCSTQFLANFAGARTDALHQPAVGNSRTSSYDTDWEPRSRLTPNHEWEMELVIPRASLGLTKGPFQDGLRLRALLARNFKRPWEQNSFEGTSTFAVVETHSQWVLSRRAPALQLLEVGNAATRKIGARLAAQAQSDTTIRWRYQSDSVTKEGVAQVRQGRWAEVVQLPDLDQPGPGRVRFTVTGADDTVLLDWSAQRSFGFAKRKQAPADGGKPVPVEYNQAAESLDDRGDQLNLDITFNPEKNYARVFGDFIHFDNRAAIQEIVIVVRDAADREIQRATTRLDQDAYAKAVLQFPQHPPGSYTVRFDCRDAAGQVIASKESSFAQENLAAKYEWWHTPRGNIEKVIAPWTPVTFEAGVFGVWGREMEVGAAGLPKRVRTQGREILAAPARLVARDAAGRELTAAGAETKLLFDKDHRKTLQVNSALGDVAVRSEVQVAFDGLYQITLTLTPRQATTWRSLQVVLPYAETMAEYIHAVTAEIRSGFWYGFTPPGRGRVWDCRLLGDRTMKLGSFIPYLWLGSTTGGLCWFADSDAGWIPSDTTPAIEIQRNAAGQVDLVFNLISDEATLDQPRTITFGLQASPVKPLHPRWREDSWWCGDTFKPYAHDGDLIFASVPFVAPDHAAEATRLIGEQHRGGRFAVPYFIHTALPRHRVPELAVFGEQWKTTVDDALCYRDSLTDYMIHHWSRWAEVYGIDGYYIDNMRPLACDNLEHGCGYRLPDGRVQPTFQMFDTRAYFLRSRALFLEQRPQSKLVLHMTNAMILPWVGPADVAYDGEHHVIYPELNKDFMDFWSLERMRVDYPAQWGVAVNFMHEYQGNWEPVDLHRAMRAYFATVMLHDALPTGNHNGHARNLMDQRAKFGLGAADVRFLPDWETTGLTTGNRDIKLAGWLRPGKLLLLVANFGEQQPAKIALDLAQLGWAGKTVSVTDAERGYQQQGQRAIPKTAAELAAERDRWPEKEAKRIANLKRNYDRAHAAAVAAGNPTPAPPDLAPKPYREQPLRREQVVVWSGDEAPAPQRNGATLTVPVARHNYRLLIVEPN